MEATATRLENPQLREILERLLQTVQNNDDFDPFDRCYHDFDSISRMSLGERVFRPFEYEIEVVDFLTIHKLSIFSADGRRLHHVEKVWNWRFEDLGEGQALRGYVQSACSDWLRSMPPLRTVDLDNRRRGSESSGEQDSKGIQSISAVSNDLDTWERGIPSLEVDSADWLLVGSEALRSLVKVKTNSLKTLRSNGSKNSSDTCGKDPQGRIWRKADSKSKLVYYFRPSLLGKEDL